jgi:transcriptional regulator with XRE-family HTH domain
MGFGERLKQARHNAGLTGTALGALCGVEKMAVSHWEHERHPPSLDQLMVICKACKVTAAWLIDGANGELSPEALRLAHEFDSAGPEKREFLLASLSLAKLGKGPEAHHDASIGPQKRAATSPWTKKKAKTKKPSEGEA